jgi:hypothetical protein
MGREEEVGPAFLPAWPGEAGGNAGPTTPTRPTGDPAKVRASYRSLALAGSLSGKGRAMAIRA